MTIELFNNQPANELFIIKRETPIQAQTWKKESYIFFHYAANIWTLFFLATERRHEAEQRKLLGAFFDKM